MKPLISTEHLAGCWALQHTISPPGEWARTYWDDWQAPHRDVIMDALRTLQPFETLLEVGCGPAPNLRRINAEFPTVGLYGLDVNAEALEWAYIRAIDADEHGEGEPWDWVAYCGALPEGLDLCQGPGGRGEGYDVILSCYTLTYVGPDAIDETLSKLSDLARKALIIAEPCKDSEAVIPGGQKDIGYQEWLYHYVSRLGNLGWKQERCLPIVPEKQRLEQVQVFVKT